MQCYHKSIQKSIRLFTDRLFEQKWIVRMKEGKDLELIVRNVEDCSNERRELVRNVFERYGRRAPNWRVFLNLIEVTHRPQMFALLLNGFYSTPPLTRIIVGAVGNSGKEQKRDGSDSGRSWQG